MAIAAKMHKEQVRLDDFTPYICHPVFVAIILSEYTDDEDLICAALLHDTVEDTQYTPEELRKDFGERVQDIVKEVTTPQYEGPGRDWAKQHKEKIIHLSKISKNGLILKVADNIHNLSDEADGFEKLGLSFLEKFNIPIEEDLKFDEKQLKLMKEKLGNIPIVQELEFTLKDTKKRILG